MFVMNCSVNFATKMKFPLKAKRKKKGGGPESEETYHPVTCDTCNTEVAMYDKDEIYHFFNVVASHSWNKCIFKIQSWWYFNNEIATLWHLGKMSVREKWSLCGGFAEKKNPLANKMRSNLYCKLRCLFPGRNLARSKWPWVIVVERCQAETSHIGSNSCNQPDTGLGQGLKLQIQLGNYMIQQSDKIK